MSALALDPVSRNLETPSTTFEAPLKNASFKNINSLETKIRDLQNVLKYEPKASKLNWKNVSAVIAGPLFIVAAAVAACFSQFTLAVCFSVSGILLLGAGVKNIFDRNQAIQKIEKEKKEISDISEMVQKLNQLNEVSGKTNSEKKQILSELKMATKDFNQPNEVHAHLEMIEKAMDSPESYDYDHSHTLLTKILTEKLDRSEINIKQAYRLLSI